MPRSSLLLAACLLAAACAGIRFGARCTSGPTRKGRIVYSDQPPSANVKTEQLRAPPPPANPNAAKELAQREADFRKRQTEGAEAATKADKERTDSSEARRRLRAGAEAS